MDETRTVPLCRCLCSVVGDDFCTDAKDRGCPSTGSGTSWRGLNRGDRRVRVEEGEGRTRGERGLNDIRKRYDLVHINVFVRFVVSLISRNGGDRGEGGRRSRGTT